MKTTTATAPLSRTISRLEHGLMLAKLAVRGEEPEDAARYLLATVKAIQPELQSLKRATPAER